MKNKKAQQAMNFLMTYGWTILIVLLVMGAIVYFTEPFKGAFPEQDKSIVYTNTIKDYFNNKTKEIEKRVYEVEQYRRTIEDLEEEISNIQLERFREWVVKTNYTNRTYPKSIGDNKDFKILSVNPTYVNIELGDEIHIIRLNKDNTFLCYERTIQKIKMIDCEEINKEEVIPNAWKRNQHKNQVKLFVMLDIINNIFSSVYL